MVETVVGESADDVASADVAALPAVVLDARGVVRALNPAASTLLPDVAVGSAIGASLDWLAAAHAGVLNGLDDGHRDQMLSAAFGVIGQRRVAAHPMRLASQDVVWSLVDDVVDSPQHVELQLARAQERAEFLLEASASLMSTLNVDRCRHVIANLAARHLADEAVVVTATGLQRRLLLTGGVSSSGAVQQHSVDADPRTVPGLAEALAGLPVAPARWLDPAQVPGWLTEPRLQPQMEAMLVTALPGPGKPVGALILLRRRGAEGFTADEEQFAQLFASRAGAALTAAKLYSEQAALTRALMHDLLPPQLHRIHGVEYAGGYRAAGDFEVVGGDFYDVHPGATPREDTLVVLGDVCGKGLEAAVLTGKIRHTIQALRSLTDDHDTLLTLLNSTLLSAESTRFATMVLASVAQRDDRTVLRLTGAGHLPPLLIRNSGQVVPADTRGTVIGALPSIKTDTFTTSLAPGEACVLYTDGVTEARGGLSGRELFGESRLAAVLQGCAGIPAEAIVERVMMQATEWAGARARDDIAVVAITAPQRTHLSAVDGHTRGRYVA